MNSTIDQLDIRFSLNPANGVPIYRQIIQQIEYGILSGRMKSGDKLPTIRSLAVELKTNPNTIAKAYNELEIRGILVTQVGNGTFISDRRPEAGADIRRAKIEEVIGRFLEEMRNLGVSRDELSELLHSGGEDELV